MINKNYLIDFFVIVIVASSYILGNHSFRYNQDFHHWGLQLSYLNDYKNGFKFFEEIYLQYGPGQTIFLFIIDKIFKINFFTIGTVVQVVYCLNLILLYKVFCFITKKKKAFLIFFFIYLIHPYVVYPWPDYLSGLSLTTAAYFLLKNKNYNLINYVFCGFFLFTSIFFRTSYLITIIPAFIIFFFINRENFFKYKINIVVYSFIFFLIIYFVYLNKNLPTWYFQGLGSITSYAYGSNHHLMDTIIQNFGENIWIFLKFIKMFLRFLFKLFNIFSLNNFIFTLFLLVNLYYILFYLYINLYNTYFVNSLLLLSLIGFFGFLQSFMIYETFRNINAALGIFFLGIHVVTNIEYPKKIIYLIKIIILLSIFILLLKFPNISNYQKFIIKNDENFVINSVNFFPKNNLLTKENNEYYSNLKKIICIQKKKIVNLSSDFILPYLCDYNVKKFSAMGAYFFFKTNPNEYKRIYEDHILFNDEILITSKNISNSNILKIFEIDLPVNMHWYSAYDNNTKKIFGYIKH